jgi:acyl-CoA thioesterase FadM
MHMLLRTILVFLTRWRLRPSHLGEVTEKTMLVLPTDLDLLWHVNNGMYFSYMDFGRFDMSFRNGVYDLYNKVGWYAVVAGETIRFKKSLKLWDRFTLQTQMVGYDDKYFFIRHKFVCRGELMATGLVKVRFLKKSGGTVSTKEFLEQLKEHPQNETPALGDEWYSLESRYL